MFIYVFSEADCEKMITAGFTFVYEENGAKAWVVLNDSSGAHVVPPGVEAVVTDRMTFPAQAAEKNNGGGRRG